MVCLPLMVSPGRLFSSYGGWALNARKVLFEGECGVEWGNFGAMRMGSFGVDSSEIMTDELFGVGLVNSVSAVRVVGSFGQVLAVVLGL